MKKFLIIFIFSILLFNSCLTNKGTLSIDSYPQNCEVYLNGEYVGVTPLEKSVKIGKYTLEVKKEGYEDYKKEVTIERGKETVIIANLEISTGSLIVKTDPDGATVFVDGKNYGLTPIEIKDLEIGEHEIVISKEGYAQIIKKIDIRKETVTIEEILIEAISEIFINTNPKGAKVIINGKEMGVTPLTLKDINPGRYIITFKAIGYEEMTKSIEVKEGLNAFNFEMIQLNHALIVESEPTGAKIYLDDVFKGTTPIEIKNLTPEKKYRLKVEVEGYLPFLTEITMPKDGSIFLPVIKLVKIGG
ncbi:MAG TPA: PEGA domain-containing protein [Caldisericia bacterium]|nr:PEGA domain-containing protein [Caldisericia bacterium]HOL82441.1 PEGA domain-containing protein [Caldisericia bacterium]